MDGRHQIPQNYKEICKIFKFCCFFFAKIEIRELAIFPKVSHRDLSPTSSFVRTFQSNFLKSCAIGSSKTSKSFMAIILFLTELWWKLYWRKFAPPNQSGIDTLCYLENDVINVDDVIDVKFCWYQQIIRIVYPMKALIKVNLKFYVSSNSGKKKDNKKCS